MIRKTIGKTENGHVFLCGTCTMIHFEYKNLNFNFHSEQEYQHFIIAFIDLDGRYWEALNHDVFFKRKIIVPTELMGFNILLTYEELLELKALFSGYISEAEQPISASMNFFCEN